MTDLLRICFSCLRFVRNQNEPFLPGFSRVCMARDPFSKLPLGGNAVTEVDMEGKSKRCPITRYKAPQGIQGIQGTQGIQKNIIRHLAATFQTLDAPLWSDHILHHRRQLGFLSPWSWSVCHCNMVHMATSPWTVAVGSAICKSYLLHMARKSKAEASQVWRDMTRLSTS